MEFYFETFKELFDCVETLESLIVTDHDYFIGMPGSPSCGPYVPGEVPVPKKIELRAWPKKNLMKDRFSKTVDEKLAFTQNDARPNLQMALDMAGKTKNMFVISVSVQLKGTYCTHMHDFFYRDLSFFPEDLS